MTIYVFYNVNRLRILILNIRVGSYDITKETLDITDPCHPDELLYVHTIPYPIVPLMNGTMRSLYSVRIYRIVTTLFKKGTGPVLRSWYIFITMIILLYPVLQSLDRKSDFFSFYQGSVVPRPPSLHHTHKQTHVHTRPKFDTPPNRGLNHGDPSPCLLYIERPCSILLWHATTTRNVVTEDTCIKIQYLLEY